MTALQTAAPRLRGKRVLLTGASSGVGRAAVDLFAREGARLALVARREEAMRDHVDRHGLDAHVIGADLADRDAARDAVEEAAAALGGLDVLVSNHAAAAFGHVSEVHPDDFDRTVAVTFTAAVDVVRAALPHLRRSQGAIVATGSLMTRAPLPTWSSYAAAKHALRGFLNSLAIEEREQRSGVTVSLVHPGPIDTPFFSQATSTTGRKPRVPPDAYRAEVVAQALVENAVRPRRETVLGGGTVVLRLLFDHARPLADRLFLLVDRWYRSGDDEAPVPGALWRTENRPAAVSGGIPSRDSLLAPLQLGRRLLPSPLTPLRLARHLVRTTGRAIALRDVLTSPQRERTPPAEPTARREPRPVDEPVRTST